MKRILFLSGILSLFFSQLLLAEVLTKNTRLITTEAQTTIPPAVRSSFKNKFPNTNVIKWEWKPNKKVYEADFRMNGKVMEAAFTADGKWVKTKTDITKAQFPAPVNEALAASPYQTWIMSDFAEIETPDKGKLYKVEVKKGSQEFNLKYDAAGNLVEKKPKQPKKK